MVKEVSIPASPLGVYPTCEFDVSCIQSLLKSKDNVIDQFKLLREHKVSVDVQKYIEDMKDYFTV